MSAEVPLNKLAEEILLQEGVKVVIRLSGLGIKYTAPTAVPSYTGKFPNALGDDDHLKRLTRRIQQLIPGVSFSVYDGDGRTHMGPQTRMGTIRSTYPRTT